VVKQANDDRKPVHLFQETIEVFTLEGQNLCHCIFALFGVISENQLLEVRQPFGCEEHVFGSGKPDAFGSKQASESCFFRLISVCLDTQLASLVDPTHEFGIVAVEFALFGLHLASDDADYFAGDDRDIAQIDDTVSSVNADVIAFLDDCAVDSELLVSVVNDDIAAADHTGFAHRSCDDGGVAGSPALAGQDAL
jgi:hypothetical protein